jgi:hypothetical protein
LDLFDLTRRILGFHVQRMEFLAANSVGGRCLLKKLRKRSLGIGSLQVVLLHPDPTCFWLESVWVWHYSEILGGSLTW